MKKLKAIAATGLVALMVTGCFGGGEPGPNLQGVLARANAAFQAFEDHLQKNNMQKATDQHMAQFNGFLQKAMNLQPELYKTPIATVLLKDASFEGFSDANGNGQVDEGEKKLFKIEVDAANKRLIATDASGDSQARGFSGMGFLAGMLIGNLMGRQRAAGIAPNHFNNRKISTPRAAAPGNRAQSGATRARSGSRPRRSGGLFGRRR
jgi:hypothetical protein